MPDYTIFDANTGTILRTLSGSFSPALIAKQARASHEIIIEGRFDDGQFYVVGQDAIERPALILPDAEELDGAFVWTIQDVPAGTRFVAELLGGDWRADGVTDSGAIEFSTAFEGVYQFTITPPAPWKQTRERREYRHEIQP